MADDTPDRDSDFLKTARERWKLADDADAGQSEREREDLAFYADEQWPADLKLARQGQQPVSGMPAVPARPTLVINKVKEPVRQILNQERQSDIGIELVPADDFGDLGITPDDTEVTLREGLIRRIQRESKAADARTWAFSRAAIAGRGYYLVMTRYLPGKTWDQEVYVHRIYNQAGVKLDPSHEQPDGSDSDWGFVGTWVPSERYTVEFPKLADGTDNDFTDADFMGLTEEYPDWYQSEEGGKGKKAIRVVDYWYTKRTARELAILEDGTSVWTEELPDGVKPLETRTVIEKQIKFCKIGGGVHELEKTDWPGQEMPIIKVLGEELQPYDDQRRAIGMVRPSRDAQMGYNYMVSKQVETIGLTPIPPLMVDPEAISQYEAWYQVANTRTLPYLPYRTRGADGQPYSEPHRPPVDPNILPIAQSINLFDQGIKSTTAVPDPTLGNVDPTLKSGRAIREVVANAQQSTSNFMDNLARSARYEGQVINNLLYPIYGNKPGRLVRILTGEGENQTMLIGDPQEMQQSQQLQAKAAKVAKLTKDAHFNVTVKVSRSFSTRREQIQSMLGQIISADPNQMLVSGDILYKNMDIPESKQLAERMRVMLAPPIQKMLAEQESGQQPLPPQVQAQLAQLQQRVQMAEQAMQQMNQELQGKQLEQQTKVQIAQSDGQRDIQLEQIRMRTELEKARMDNAAKMYVADVQARIKGVLALHDAEHEAVAMAHEAVQNDIDRSLQQRQTAQGMAHEAALGAGQQDFDAQQTQGQQGFDAAMAQQQTESEGESV